MSREGWTTIRIRVKTRERINARISEMVKEYYLGHQSRTPVDAGKLSIDELLNWLLSEREEHRARARRANGAGKGKGASADKPGSEPEAEADRVG
jgi:hypothetical protein